MTSPEDYKKFAVLYVDDEEQALKYFSKGMGKEFRVLTATSVAEACTILDREGATIGVIITDQRMPNQFGVELLKRARGQWPGIVRILVTAYSDIESAIESVNSGAIFKYITKPADFKLLKESLKSAMELFLGNLQRDAMLTERLEVMQRMVVADRVKSLAMMAGGISHHLRNSMTAMSCFLEEMAAAGSGKSAEAPVISDMKYVEQLWTLAQQERTNLLRIIQSVGQGVAEPDCAIAGETDPAELARGGISAATPALSGRSVELACSANLPALKVDADAVSKLLKMLLIYANRLNQAQGKLTINVAPAMVGGAPGVTMALRGEGPAWSRNDVDALFTPFAFPSNDPSDLGIDLLSAFSIAHLHGGDVVVHPAPPAGPGFELRLPSDPAAVHRSQIQDGLAQKLFTQVASAPPTHTQGDKAA